MIMRADQHQRKPSDGDRAGARSGHLVFVHASTSGSATSPRRGCRRVQVAPKGPVHLVRREYVDGRGVPVLSPSRRTRRQRVAAGPSYAKAIGGLRAGGIRRRSTEETETDLFGEQACCAAAPRNWSCTASRCQPRPLPARVAYFECLTAQADRRPHVRGGIAKQRWSVSDTAEYGDFVSGRGHRLRRVKEK